MKRQSLNIEARYVKRSDTTKEKLVAGGGDLKVLYLRIHDGERGYKWMYESSDISSKRLLRIRLLQLSDRPTEKPTKPLDISDPRVDTLRPLR